MRGPAGGGVDCSDWCFGFVLGLFSCFGGCPGISETADCALFVRGKGHGFQMLVFGAVLGEKCLSLDLTPESE